MCSTPAPPSTAFVAAAIWSGAGEVKSAAEKAASNMPGPTNPPCMGSWRLPPPETSPTLPFLGASLRMMTFGSYSTRIRSAWAAAIPAMASLTSVSGVLINFLSRVVTAASAIAASSSLLLLLCRQDASEHEHPESLTHQEPQTDRRQVDSQQHRLKGRR